MSIHSQLRDLEEHTPWVSFPLFSGGSVSVAALKGKAFPSQKYQLCLGSGRGVEVVPQNVSAVLQKISWQLGAKK